MLYNISVFNPLNRLIRIDTVCVTTQSRLTTEKVLFYVLFHVSFHVRVVLYTALGHFRPAS